ncbi:Uncharacterized protein APZ42_025939 [Daphnia magna]|uniref:Integrase catalytic domain-containing protein n=1 Tax=Daphnia magna TaxID=35525 RepID=A0A162DC25_9CRUS|nr:Uncharacterized protein APZ42_025939 [Daphnia magna]
MSSYDIYHPQANGAVESMNRTLAVLLSMYFSTDRHDWDDTLKYVYFAYNTARQESTGYSPFVLLYRREQKLLTLLELGADPKPLLTEDCATANCVDRLLTKLSTAREMVKSTVIRGSFFSRQMGYILLFLFDGGDSLVPTVPLYAIPISLSLQPAKKIINLPEDADNGTHSVTFSNQPNFLSAAADLKTFLELSKDDVRVCSKIG